MILTWSYRVTNLLLKRLTLFDYVSLDDNDTCLLCCYF